MAPLPWLVNTNSTIDDEFRNQAIFAADLAEWDQTRSGPVRLSA
jgi:hypothetical protein